MRSTEQPSLAAAGFRCFRRIAAVGALLGVALLAVGCGDDDTASATGETEVEQDGGASAFPVTIAQKEGEVTIEARPERVVALDYASADAALALGVVPVGIAEVTYVEGGVMEWTRRRSATRRPRSSTWTTASRSRRSQHSIRT